MKFVSHLDMNRFMSRLITKSKIPIWYTEGFNQHIYMNFAIPLSLGFEGLYEIMDIRLTDDEYPLEMCLEALNSVAPDDIVFTAVKEPKENMKEIAFAQYDISLNNFSGESKQQLAEFLQRESVLCLKKGKKGKLKEIDIIPKIRCFEIKQDTLCICVNAGCEDTLNPSLVLSTFFEQTQTESCFYSVVRTAVLNKKGELFE